MLVLVWCSVDPLGYYTFVPELHLSPLGVVGSVGGPITDGSLWDRDRLRVRVRLGLGCTGRGEAWGSRELCACAGHQMSCYVMLKVHGYSMPCHNLILDLLYIYTTYKLEYKRVSST